MNARSVATATALTLLAGSASAQSWSEDFDSYGHGFAVDPGGTSSIGNGWESWSNAIGSSTVAGSGMGTPAAPGALSAPNSLSNNPGADTVNRFYSYPGGHPTSGRWTFSGNVQHTSTYVGDSLWILLNTYGFGGPYSWSVQVHFDGDMNLVDCDCANMNDPGGPQVMIRDAWVPFRAEIDLDNDVVDVFYNGASLTGGQTYSWTSGIFGTSTGLLEIHALDLYPDLPGHPNTTRSYYDDLSLDPAPGTIGSPDPGCTPLANSIGTVAVVSLMSSGVAGDVVEAQLTGGVPGQFGYWLSGPATALIPVGCGLVCIGGPASRYNLASSGEVYQFDAGAVSQNTAGGGPNTLATDGSGGGGGVPAVLVGETRGFQAWYRDPGCPAPNQAFNFSDSRRVTFGSGGGGGSPITVSNITPSAGGTVTVMITGTGFDPNPFNNSIHIAGETSAAYITSGGATVLNARVVGSVNTGTGAVRVVVGSGTTLPDNAVNIPGAGSSLSQLIRVFAGAAEGTGSSFNFNQPTPNTVEGTLSAGSVLRFNLATLGGPWSSSGIFVDTRVHSPAGWADATFELDFGPGVATATDAARHLAQHLVDLGQYVVTRAGTAVSVTVQGADRGFGSITRLP